MSHDKCGKLTNQGKCERSDNSEWLVTDTPELDCVVTTMTPSWREEEGCCDSDTGKNSKKFEMCNAKETTPSGCCYGNPEGHTRSAGSLCADDDRDLRRAAAHYYFPTPNASAFNAVFSAKPDTAVLSAHPHHPHRLRGRSLNPWRYPPTICDPKNRFFLWFPARM